jgi:3-phenylpropionate/trans-cinnamate dioxygenase ferredoxin component
VPFEDSRSERDLDRTGLADKLLPEDVAPFEHGGKSYALYRTADDRFYATDGHCTHEDVELADGFVSGTIIKCPMHNGRFDFTTDEPKGAPACINLKTHSVRIEAGRILLKIKSASKDEASSSRR